MRRMRTMLWSRLGRKETGKDGEMRRENSARPREESVNIPSKKSLKEPYNVDANQNLM